MFDKSSIHLWTRLVLPGHVGKVAVLDPGSKRRCVERVGNHLEAPAPAYIDLSNLFTNTTDESRLALLVPASSPSTLARGTRCVKRMRGRPLLNTTTRTLGNSCSSLSVANTSGNLDGEQEVWVQLPAGGIGCRDVLGER